MTSFSDLLKKYDVQVPRYTSYPTVPYWSNNPTTDQWIDSIRRTLQKPQTSWSMYIHVPYCETLCTFCGCNTSITKDHKQELPYVQNLIQEFDLYLERATELKSRPLIQLHLGGGTPTFLSPENLRHLVTSLLSKVQYNKSNFEGSVEVDPRRTTREQLQVLRELGFDRVSLGVQDFNHEVQILINRVQPYDITKRITDWARELGYRSVNYDLIYGLPVQTLERMQDTIRQTIELRPDRIALYSFALVPWIKPAQRLFKDSDLPNTEEKRRLYEVAREMLLNAGYVEIGMDHFALPEEALRQAQLTGKLHRNFMGYTDHRTDVLLGLGVSAISEAKDCFHQNEKVLPKYQQMVTERQIPTLRGHLLSERDQIQRERILQLMTQLKISKKEVEEFDFSEFQKEDMVSLTENELLISERGRPFLRNICSRLDDYLSGKPPESKTFSKSI